MQDLKPYLAGSKACTLFSCSTIPPKKPLKYFIWICLPLLVAANPWSKGYCQREHTHTPHTDLRFHKESTEQNMETHPTSITSFLGYTLFCGRCPKTTAYVLGVNNLISVARITPFHIRRRTTCSPRPLHSIIRKTRKHTIVRKHKAYIPLFSSILLEWVST